MDVRSFFQLTEIDRAELLVGPLFKRKFGDPPPDHGRHFVALVRDERGFICTAAYTHFTPFGSIMLGGGACTDERVPRTLSREAREALAQAGGVYFRC